jgi:hypothetical protein
MRERPRHPARAAHLHFDIDKPYRGVGIGRRLWQNYEVLLRAAGVKQCYGEFLSYPSRRPEQVYSRFGFAVFDRRVTTLFDPEIPGTVEVVCVQKEL